MIFIDWPRKRFDIIDYIVVSRAFDNSRTCPRYDIWPRIFFNFINARYYRLHFFPPARLSLECKTVKKKIYKLVNSSKFLKLSEICFLLLTNDAYNSFI